MVEHGGTWWDGAEQRQIMTDLLWTLHSIPTQLHTAPARASLKVLLATLALSNYSWVCGHMGSLRCHDIRFVFLQFGPTLVLLEFGPAFGVRFEPGTFERSGIKWTYDIWPWTQKQETGDPG